MSYKDVLATVGVKSSIPNKVEVWKQDWPSTLSEGILKNETSERRNSKNVVISEIQDDVLNNI